jgi:hypothetical protein
MSGLSEAELWRLRQGWCILANCENVSAVGRLHCYEHELERASLALMSPWGAGRP